MELMTFVTSVTGLAIIGFVALMIGFDYLKFGISKTTRSLCRVIGVCAIGLAFLTYSGISLIGEDQAPPATTVGTFDVTGSESHSYVTVNNDAKTFTWEVQYNSTTSAIYGANAATFTFSISRGLGTVGLAQTYGEVTSVPVVSNSTSGVNYNVLTKTGEDYNALWTRADATTAYEMVTVTIAETADGAVVTLNMTLNPGAIGSMDQYESLPIGVMIGGETWTVYLLLTDNSI
jgi:hypothetical protein